MFTYDIVILFDVLVLLSILLVAFALLPAVSSRYVSRSVGWYSLMTGWLVFSLSYGLIVGYQGERRPPLSLCTFQTLLIYAVPQLVATSLLCYYIEFYLIISGLRTGKLRSPSQTRTFLLAVAPWVVFFFNIVTVSILIFPGNRLHLVERAPNNFYCHLSNPIPATITSATVIGVIGVLLPLEAWTGLVMYRHWDAFRRLSKADSRIYLALYIRFTLSTMVSIAAFLLSTLLFILPRTYRSGLCYPFLFCFIHSGHHYDCCFWYPKRHSSSLDVLVPAKSATINDLLRKNYCQQCNIDSHNRAIKTPAEQYSFRQHMDKRAGRICPITDGTQSCRAEVSNL